MLARNVICLSRPILKSKGITSNVFIRHLYSGAELGIKKYEDSRKVVGHAIANHEFFKHHFRKQLLNTEFNLTNLEYGLKNLLHIIQNSESDVSLLRDALRTLVYKQKEYEGDKYRFDTIVLRAFHYLNMPDEAIQFFEDDYLRPIFKQVTGYQILLDLLYENDKFADVLRIYGHLTEYGQLHQNKYIDVIILATYYRQNTPEALEQACELWNRISETNNKVQFRKSRTFVAGLALKQNQPELTLKILEGETTYVTMRHLKLLAWAQLGKFDPLFDMFKAIIRRHEENPKYVPQTSLQVLNDIERYTKMKGSEADIDQFRSLRKKIESLELVSKKSLDDLICAPFPVLPQANIYHKRT